MAGAEIQGVVRASLPGVVTVSLPAAFPFLGGSLSSVDNPPLGVAEIPGVVTASLPGVVTASLPGVATASLPGVVTTSLPAACPFPGDSPFSVADYSLVAGCLRHTLGDILGDFPFFLPRDIINGMHL